MAPKDYYLVLGISREESPRGVRKAFRDLARQHHPDRAGPDGTPLFREVVEAYQVLSDPERRREHDAALGLRHRPPSSPRGARVREARRSRVRGARRGVPFDALGLFGHPDSVRPSADDLLDRILRNFMRPDGPKSERLEPLLCDVALSRDEAQRGGVLPIRIPVAGPCPACHGVGHIVGFRCPRCDATGEASSEIVVPLEVPPGVRSGGILEAPLDRFGIRNLWLRARIRVEA